jgi:phage shock protein PspC (stress-responsive transcriptional regulator)
MPSLVRFLVVVGVLVGLVYAAIYALAIFVEPTSREMTITIPRDLLTKPR